MANMNDRFHIVLGSPDGTVFPSFNNADLHESGSPEIITLLMIRHKCKVSEKYKFTMDGKTSIQDSTTLGYYIQVTPENAAKYSKPGAVPAAGAAAAAAAAVAAAAVAAAPAPTPAPAAATGAAPAPAAPAAGVPAGVPAAGVPAAGVPAAGVPAAGVPAAGVPAAGVPAAGVPAAGVPAAPALGVPAAPAAGVPATPAAGVPADVPVADGAAAPGPQTIATITIKLVLAKQIPPSSPRAMLAQSNQLEGLQKMLDSQKSTLQPGQLARLSASLGSLDASKEIYATQAGTNDAPEPADLTEQQWEKILFNNQALHGWCINGKDGTITRAVKRAFVIRRPLPIGELSKEAKAYFNGIPGTPRFIVQDDSGVTVTQIQNPFQFSLANESFSSTTIQASVSGAAKGMAASVSASRENSKETSDQSLEFQKIEALHVSYNFPRVIVRLNAETLQLSDECKKDAKNVSNDQELIHFYRAYGSVFSTIITLGGRLHSTKILTEKENSNLEETKTSLRFAAGASFSSPFVSISASYARSDASKHSEDESTLARKLVMTWDVRGGDTTLCSNPPVWASTVKDYCKWRIMNQSGVISMLTHIAAIDVDAGTNLKNPMRSITDNPLNDSKMREVYEAIHSGSSNAITEKVQQFFNSGRFDRNDFNQLEKEDGDAGTSQVIADQK